MRKETFGNPMSLRPSIVLTVLAALLVCLLIISFGQKPSGPPLILPQGQPILITFEMTIPNTTNYSIADARLNEATLKALGAAREVSAHKCKKLGVMTLSYTNRPAIKVEILPGHQTDHLDFVYNGQYYTGPGKEFQRALNEAR